MENTEKRALVLVKAMVDILNQMKDSYYVLDVFEQTAIWDNAECDGYCWLDDAKALLGIEED